MTPRDRYLAWRRQLASAGGGCSTCRVVRAAVRRILPAPRPPAPRIR